MDSDYQLGFSVVTLHIIQLRLLGSLVRAPRRVLFHALPECPMDICYSMTLISGYI